MYTYIQVACNAHARWALFKINFRKSRQNWGKVIHTVHLCMGPRLRDYGIYVYIVIFKLFIYILIIP